MSSVEQRARHSRALLGMFGGALLVALPVVAVVAAPNGKDGPPATDASSPGSERMAVCTFSNPSYSGECVERVGISAEGSVSQACRVVLDCLNDSRCAKDYCRSTTIRQGWKLESAKEEGGSGG